MNLANSLSRALQTIEFARHIPMSKLLRRMELDIKRRANPRLSFRKPRALAPGRAPIIPLPLFEPRTHLAPAVSGSFLLFTFLNRPVQIDVRAFDWGAPGPGPSNQLWRMNLHYMEYLESSDDALWAVLVMLWIEAHPDVRPGTWRDSWNSYALSIRVVVWLQQLALRADRIQSHVVAAAEESAAAQLRFLERALETDLGGNHLIKNIKALLWASAFFAGADALRWRALGLRLLSKQLKMQILADGMHYERSASYHAQVFADLLECRHALGEDPLDGALDAALGRMAQVMADLAHPDSGPVLFNDAGTTMAYSPAACLDAYAKLFQRYPRPRRVFGLENAGYYGLRAGTAYIVADCGRIAPDDLPAHGHADVLSFELSLGDCRIIVDQGVFEYCAGERRHNARSAWNHNTLCFEGADQADFFGAFRCARRPNVRVLHYEAKPDGFILEGTHDGFRNLRGCPVHSRRFEAGCGRLAVRDRVSGHRNHEGRIGFLLHPDVQAIVDGRNARLDCGPYRLSVVSSHPLIAAPAVWWPDMGHELPTRRLTIHVPKEVPSTMCVVTTFEWEKPCP